VSLQCAELASGSDSTINCRSKGCGTIDFYNRSASSFKLGPSRIIIKGVELIKIIKKLIKIDQNLSTII